MATPAAPAGPLRPCLSEDTLLLLLDGKLDAEAKAGVDAHVGACPDCARLVAASIEAAFASQPAAEAAPLAAAASLASGNQVGRYRVLGAIGAGAMGVVYRARDPDLGRDVALKLLRPGGDGRGQERPQLLREAQAMARLSHPNVVAVYDFGEYGAQVFIAMELVDGGTLADWASAEPRGWREVVAVFESAGRGLAAAHAAGLVHRDFKPGNVLVGKDGRVRVTDFGLARIASGEGRADAAAAWQRAGPPPSPQVAFTHAGKLVGSPAYMAPEQLQGGAADARSDIFAFTVALYECLCGERPFAGDTLTSLRERVAAGETRDLPRGVRLPAFLRRVLARGLRADPAHRYASMDELLLELQRGPVVRRRRIQAALGAALLASAGLAFWLDAWPFNDARRKAALCAAGPSQLAAVWGPARGEELRAAFVATHAADSAGSFERTRTALDEYAARWAAEYRAACEATHLRREQSEQALDLKMECLGGHRRELSALVDVLAQPDARVVLEAPKAARTLPSLSDCASASSLRALRPVPQAQAALAAELREAMARGGALTLAGRLRDGLAAGEAVEKRARALGHPGLLAEALHLVWYAKMRLGFAAVRELHECAQAADRAGDDKLRAQAFIALGFFEADRNGEIAEGEKWAGYADAAIARLDHADGLAGFQARLRGLLLLERGQPAEALAALEQAEDAFRRDHQDTTYALEYQLKALQALGRPQQALEVARRSLAWREEAFGGAHPHVAFAADALARVLSNLGRHDEALLMGQRGLQIREAALGRDAPVCAFSHNQLADVLAAAGRKPEALAHRERALELIGAPSSKRNFTVASAALLAAEVGDLPRARRHAEQLLAIPQIEHTAPALAAKARFALARALYSSDRARARTLAVAAASAPSLAAEVARWSQSHP